MTRRITPQAIMVLLCIILATLFYAHFRESTWLGQQLNWANVSNIQLPVFLLEHFPSFIQTLFLGLSFLLITKHSKTHGFGFSLLLASGFELLQLTPLLPGTFATLDLVAVLLGALALLLIHSKKQPETNHTFKKLSLGSLFVSGYLLSLGCMGECDPDDQTCVVPVTISWNELRGDINPNYGNESVLTRSGKIHVKDEHLFVMDSLRGVHIFDQTDPQHPIRLVFIPVIGATDISLQGDYVYVNSFTDLVGIDYSAVLNGSFNQTHVTRIPHAFTPPHYSEFIPAFYGLEGEYEKYDDYIYRSYQGRDQYPKKGFIIGYYDANSEAVLFGEYDEEELRRIENETFNQNGGE